MKVLQRRETVQFVIWHSYACAGQFWNIHVEEKMCKLVFSLQQILMSKYSLILTDEQLKDSKLLFINWHQHQSWLTLFSENKSA